MVASNTEYVHLSFEEFLNDSLECFSSITTTSKKLDQTRESFYENIAFLKKSYRMRSTEDEKLEDKKTFGTKIKDFFIKTWTFLVSIFSKIIEVVLSLIKTIIIFVQKKKVQMNSIFKLFQKDGGIKGFNNTNSNIIRNMLTSNVVLKTFTLDKVSYKHIKICEVLISSRLKKFAELKISPNDRTSVSSLSYIKSQIDKETKDQLKPGNSHSVESKFKIIEDTINKFYMNGILLNSATDSKDGTFVLKLFSNNTMNAEDAFSTGNIDKIAHAFVYGVEKKPEIGETNLLEYFGCHVGDGANRDENFKILEQAFNDYYNVSKKLFDTKDGYISKIEATLKTYKEISRNDHKLISEMNKNIIAEINKYLDDETPEAKSKISLFHRITKIVMKIKDIKSHFIRLRQQIIIDVMNLYSIENKAWWTLAGNGKFLKEKYEEGDDGIRKDNIIKVPEVVY